MLDLITFSFFFLQGPIIGFTTTFRINKHFNPSCDSKRTIVGLTGHLKGMGSTKLHLFRFAIMSDFTPNLSNPFKIREYVNTSLDCTVDISLDNTYRQFCNLLIYQKKINGCSLAQARIVFPGSRANHALVAEQVNVGNIIGVLLLRRWWRKKGSDTLHFFVQYDFDFQIIAISSSTLSPSEK